MKRGLHVLFFLCVLFPLAACQFGGTSQATGKVDTRPDTNSRPAIDCSEKGFVAFRDDAKKKFNIPEKPAGTFPPASVLKRYVQYHDAGIKRLKLLKANCPTGGGGKSGSFDIDKNLAEWIKSRNSFQKRYSERSAIERQVNNETAGQVFGILLGVAAGVAAHKRGVSLGGLAGGVGGQSSRSGGSSKGICRPIDVTCVPGSNYQQCMNMPVCR